MNDWCFITIFIEHLSILLLETIWAPQFWQRRSKNHCNARKYSRWKAFYQEWWCLTHNGRFKSTQYCCARNQNKLFPRVRTMRFRSKSTVYTVPSICWDRLFFYQHMHHSAQWQFVIFFVCVVYAVNRCYSKWNKYRKCVTIFIISNEHKHSTV